jgi:2,5-diketo-D-gluconate reductase A
MAPPAPTVTLNTGHEMPQLGLGTWPLKGPECTEAVLAAIASGYRLVDTAAKYDNEDAVGAAVRSCGRPRDDLFVTTKLRGSEQGAGSTREALARSLERLGLDHVDLYLIHWPLPRLDRYRESWAELLTLAQEGLARSVGVSNFQAARLAAIVADTGVEPAVNQIQVSPTIAKTDLVATIQATSTVVQSWSPLERNSGVLTDPTVLAVAARHGVRPAQVVLRWLIERGITAVPRSGDPVRQRENLDVFGFALTDDDRAALASLHRQAEGRLDPATHEEF